MTPKPHAALALWNDVAPERDDEYEQWHAVEHVPERVWCPGFVRATRYAAHVGSGPKYFTLYELETLDALGSPQYRELVQHPTPWSASMRGSMSRFVRKPIALSVLYGEPVRSAIGGLVTLRAVWPTAPAGWADQMAGAARALQAAAPDVLRIGGGWAVEAGPQAIANERDAPEGVEAVLWAELEGEVDAARLDARRHDLAQRALALWPGTRWSQTAGYRLLTHAPRTRAQGSPRPAPRTDLMHNHPGDHR